MAILQSAQKYKTIHAMKLNPRSSRGHTVFTLELKQQFRLNDCLTDKFADIRDARRSRGTKGGGRGSQKGGGGKGSFGSRGKGGGGKGGRYGKGGK